MRGFIVRMAQAQVGFCSFSFTRLPAFPFSFSADVPGVRCNKFSFLIFRMHKRSEEELIVLGSNFGTMSVSAVVSRCAEAGKEGSANGCSFSVAISSFDL